MKVDNIIMKFCSYNDREFLKNVPHREFLDLGIIYADATTTNDGVMFITVTNEIMSKLGMTEPELFALAKENTIRKFPATRKIINDGFRVITNEPCDQGAINTLIDGNLEYIANLENKNLYILPMSVHEMGIIPDVGQQVEFLQSVVESANKTVVKSKDVLSYSVYYYNKDTKEISIISDGTTYSTTNGTTKAFCL